MSLSSESSTPSEQIVTLLEVLQEGGMTAYRRPIYHNYPIETIVITPLYYYPLRLPDMMCSASIVLRGTGDGIHSSDAISKYEFIRNSSELRCILMQVAYDRHCGLLQLVDKNGALFVTYLPGTSPNTEQYTPLYMYRAPVTVSVTYMQVLPL